MAQNGYVYEGSDGKSFHVRYYVTEIVDGKPDRKQRSHKLCEKNRDTGHARVTPSEPGTNQRPLVKWV